MGYEYTIQGWYKAKSPVNLDRVLPTVIREYEFAEHDALDFWFRVTGRSRNYVLFGTEAKHQLNYYLAALSGLMEEPNHAGNGLITVTGEWCYDGKDQFVLATGGSLFNLPTARIYDPLSPWNAVYRWSHYMGRNVGELSDPDPPRLREALAGRGSVKGWLRLHEFQTAEADASRITAEIIDRDPRLDGGISFLNQFSEPHILIGQDAVDAASAVMLLAEITGRYERSYGMLYCSDADEQSQVPVAFEGGGILPEIRLTPQAEQKLIPVPSIVYEGLGHGFQAIPLRSSLNLNHLNRELHKALGGQPVVPNDGWRKAAGVSGPCYLFEAFGLMLILTTNDGQVPEDPYVGWPHFLVAHLEAGAEPELLKLKVKEVAARLKVVGIETGPTWPR